MTSQFEKYELLVTPLLLVMVVIFIYFGGIIQSIVGESFIELFLLPSLVGNTIGFLITLLLDFYWKKIDPSTIGKFLRLPTLVLILIALLASLLVNIDINISLAVISLGLGSMFSTIIFSSLLAYYREFIVG